MCFALPLRVASISKNFAVMENGRRVNFSIVKPVKKGQWLLVQSNLAVDKLTQAEAKSMRTVLKEISNGLKS